MIRKAMEKDLAAVNAIYQGIHDREEKGETATGWKREVYPTEETARRALFHDELFVMEEEGQIVATARINQEQEEAYSQVNYWYPAAEEQVLVLHTLVVAPWAAGHGYGQRFVAYYEELARHLGCTALRMDTNARNLPARRIYQRLGYREAGIVPCNFQGLGDVELVCLEKAISCNCNLST